MLIDLHTHSYPSSDDSFMSADELIEEARRLGLDGVCLTDHDAFWSGEETRALSRRHDFLVLPGVELNTDSGHVLVFGLDRYLFGMHKPAFLRQLVDQKGGVMIAAHPYRRRFLEEPGRKAESRGEMLDRAGGDEFFGYCDAIEGINGRGSDQENWFSLELRDRLAMRSTGGSDAHRIGQIGTAATRFQARITGLPDLIEEIRLGRFCPVDLKNGGASGASSL
jgi:predicted metal-dependent phosphoesterase TrpH